MIALCLYISAEHRIDFDALDTFAQEIAERIIYESRINRRGTLNDRAFQMAIENDYTDQLAAEKLTNTAVFVASRTAIRVAREVAKMALSAIADDVGEHELADRRAQFNNLVKCIRHGDTSSPARIRSTTAVKQLL